MYTINMKFVWDTDKYRANLKKHGVSFEDAAKVFLDAHYLLYYDNNNSSVEQRFNVIGLTDSGLLFVVFVERIDNVIRIISARKVTKLEKKIYEENK